MVWEHGIEENLLQPSRLETDGEERFSGVRLSYDPQQTELEEIYLTGHSLGGAMAVLAALDMQGKAYQSHPLWSKCKGIYTYGQPMVAGEDSRQTCEELIGQRVYRHVFKNDIVPHLPPLSTGAFDHFGHELKVYKDAHGWEHRTGWFDNKLLRPRTTQVVSALGAAPFALADFVMYNVQWLFFVPKSPWSINDHNPLFYMTAFPQQEG